MVVSVRAQSQRSPRRTDVLGRAERMCARARTRAGGNRHMDWPHRGVYFFMEQRRSRHDVAKSCAVREDLSCGSPAGRGRIGTATIT
jgi:hypothetical protein